MVTIIKEDEHEYVTLEENRHGWGYQLKPVVSLRWTIKELNRLSVDHEIMTDKELRKTNRFKYSIYRVLKILQQTNDGNMGSPWLNKETFENLLYEFEDFTEWNIKYGDYPDEQEKYERL